MKINEELWNSLYGILTSRRIVSVCVKLNAKRFFKKPTLFIKLDLLYIYSFIYFLKLIYFILKLSEGQLIFDQY